MCEKGLNNKDQARKWLLENHPDRGGKAADAGLVGECFRQREFCTGALPVKQSPGTVPKSAKSNHTSVNEAASNNTRKNNSRAKSSVDRIFQRVRHVSVRRDNVPDEKPAAYKPNARQMECVRQVGNWSKIGPNNRFDKTRFDIKGTDKLIPIASPKLEAMLQNIAALDAHDMEVHGKKFKHFIFSDLKMLGYGAKIISAAFIVRGIKPVLKFDKSRIVLDVPKGDGDKFAVLSSTALWNSPFKHKLKKEVLDMYNKRPDNVYGETCRFIILDSGFKEGIDLFDVRYVHLFEPLMTEADMTQALGRATRLCGQKGLEFVPNEGWSLNVYKYSQNIPEQLQMKFKATTLFEIALQLKGLDTRLHSISKAIKDVSILSAVDQPLTEEIHKSDLMPRIVTKKPSNNAPVSMVLTKTMTDMTENLARTNMSKKLALENNPVKQLLLEDKVQSAKDISTLEAIADSEPRLTDDPCKDCLGLSGALVPFAPSRLSTKVITPTVMTEKVILYIDAPKGAAPSSFPVTKGHPTSWYALRRYISEEFKNMSWPPQEVVNKCIDKPAAAAFKVKEDEKDYIVPPKQKTLPKLKLVDYTPTQDFISNYFTVDSPVKGMLLWHSVGTGKTCSAIALASTQFEPEGYSIIWVTRHTLKADIWKNVFDQVCHRTIAQEVREGKLSPEDVEKRQRQMGAQWIPPMSYRQFSNVVQGKNPIYEVLKKRNGKEDPLKKTLIIIDEAHKLYSADFKGAEKPDVPAFMAALQNSYKVSGADSARVLLMSATPYNESPMELMMLLNLCREKEQHLPTEMSKFVEKYMDETGNFTQEGLLEYMNAIAGQISYLNREADPSQFTQPTFIDIVVPISTYQDVNMDDSEDVRDINQEMATLMEEKRALEEEVIPHLQTQISMIGPAMEARIGECKGQMGAAEPPSGGALHRRVRVTAKATTKATAKAKATLKAAAAKAKLKIAKNTAKAKATAAKDAAKVKAAAAKAKLADAKAKAAEAKAAAKAKLAAAKAAKAATKTVKAPRRVKPETEMKACVSRVTKKYAAALKLEEGNLRNAIKRVEKIEKEYVKLQKKAGTVTKKLKKNGLASMTQEGQLEARCKIGLE